MQARVFAVVMLLISSAWASGGFFQRATVTSMQTAECVTVHRSFVAAMSGVPDTRRENCAEYILVTETTTFRVQASRSLPLLLPAENLSFRPGKGSLVLHRDDQLENFEVSVVCMQLRNNNQEECAVADKAPLRMPSRNSR